MKISRFQAGRVHGVDDDAGLACHISREIGIDDILILHGVAQRSRVEYVALDDRYPLRGEILEPGGPAQIKRQGQVAIVEQNPRRVARKLPVGAENQDTRHGQTRSKTLMARRSSIAR